VIRTIRTGYAVTFRGVPFVMSRVVPGSAKAVSGLLDFLLGKVDTLYGPIYGAGATAQMILVLAASQSVSSFTRIGSSTELR
jgi:hypothetical protein